MILILYPVCFEVLSITPFQRFDWLITPISHPSTIINVLKVQLSKDRVSGIIFALELYIIIILLNTQHDIIDNIDRQTNVPSQKYHAKKDI